MVENPFHQTTNPFEVNEEDEIELKDRDPDWALSDTGEGKKNASSTLGLDSSAISVEDTGRNSKSAHDSLGLL